MRISDRALYYLLVGSFILVILTTLRWVP